MRHLFILLALLCIGMLAALPAFAGDEVTPTPAPSKTATPETVATEEATPEATMDEAETEAAFVPLTQADLTVITGNVQRPNGMIWYNDKLYVVCTGDWTIYEIDPMTGSTITYIQGTRNGHALYAETGANNTLTLWLPDFDVNALLMVNAARYPVTAVSNLSSPWGITYFDPRNFLITNLRANNIVMTNRDGTVTPVLGELRSPTGIVRHGDYVYFANSGSARRAIEWFDASVLEVEEGEAMPEVTPQPLVSGLQSTTGLVLAPDGYLYFAYALGTRGVVGRVNPDECRENGGCTNNEIEVVLYTELAAPLAGLTISPDMQLFVHTMFRPEIYWVQLEG